MNRLASILFQMEPLNAARESIGIAAMRGLDIHLDFAFTDNRVRELADLIALRQVGIEIILPVEAGIGVDLRLQAEAGTDSLLDAILVDHGQHAGHCRIDQRHIAVGVRTKRRGRARKQLRIGRDLSMDFEAHDQFPIAGFALDDIWCARGHSVPCWQYDLALF